VHLAKCLCPGKRVTILGVPAEKAPQLSSRLLDRIYNSSWAGCSAPACRYWHKADNPTASAQNKRLRQSQSDTASCVVGAAMVRDAGRLCLRYQSPPPSITQTSAPRLTSQCALYEQSNRNMQSRELQGQGVRMPFPQAMPQGRARA
jgi:hypothetical protein